MAVAAVAVTGTTQALVVEELQAAEETAADTVVTLHQEQMDLAAEAAAVVV